ncbi:MAG: hypothetical protein AB8D78_05575, partial [Akkermansiaceae bacterium]
FYGTITITILAVILGAFIATNMILSQRAKADTTEACSNARSFGLALFEFETEYGSFPNDATAKAIKQFPSTPHNLSGSSSNAAFRQLIAAGVTQSEHFYARIPGTTKPDFNITPGEALKKGEIGFSYISGLSSKDDPATPIVLTPLIPGTTTFDPKPFRGFAVILHIDNSVRTYDIANDGHIYDKGINLLSPKHPVWKGKTPDIRYPE